MVAVFLTEYNVSGMKCIHQMVTLSFYKKQISKHPDTQNYTVKAIYGEHGSGKSGIVASVGILKNILTNPVYLSNDRIQDYIERLINQRTRELVISVQYLVNQEDPYLYSYTVELAINEEGQIEIQSEKLCRKKGTSKNKPFATLFSVKRREISELSERLNLESVAWIKDISQNLLGRSSLSSLFASPGRCKILKESALPILETDFFQGILSLRELGRSLRIYMEDGRDPDRLSGNSVFEEEDQRNFKIVDRSIEGQGQSLSLSHLSPGDNQVRKEDYPRFEAEVQKLTSFMQVFQKELLEIEIERKEDKDLYHCFLILKYPTCKIASEDESSGTQKLIRLFPYLKSMVNGSIVFMDGLDSNLHEVYLCKLVQYLMQEGQGQLCFTTQNIGLMDVLKTNKKSIDFLSDQRVVYPWIKNGNYSPSKLYREGMIAGSAFNVDSIDFIGCFDKS